jgi:hypothetical protein
MSKLYSIALVAVLAATLASAAKKAPYTADVSLTALVEGENIVVFKTATPFGADSDSIEMAVRPRWTPTLNVTAAGGVVTAVAIDFGAHAFAMPASTLRVLAGDGKLDKAHQLAPKPTERSLALDAAEFGAANTQLTLTVAPQDVTSFAYHLEEGLPADLVSSGQKYDLVPRNSTMLTKFMVQVTGKTLSVWVTRKPPTPHFTLMVQSGGVPLTHVNIQSGAGTSDALGFDLPMAPEDLAALKGKSVTFAVHFFEAAREVATTATINNLRATLESLSQEGAAAATLDVPTTVDGLALQLHYHKAAGFMGLKVLQAEPMAAFLMTLYRVEAGTKVILLREGDDVVPFYADRKQPLQYGWDDALPTNASAMTVGGVDLLASTVFAELSYDKLPKAEAGTGAQLKRWVKSYGGDVEQLELAFLDTAGHSYERKHQLITTHPVKAGEHAGIVSYSNFFPVEFAQRGAYATHLGARLAEHARHVAKENIHPEAQRIMLLSVSVLLQLYEESTNYRPFFNTFAASAYKIPAFYGAAELAAFAFDPEVALEVARSTALWAVEFGVLDAAKAQLPRPFTKDGYFAVRSQIETRLFNISGNLVLTPVVDLMTHDDDANAELRFHDEQNKVTVTALRDVAAGAALTFDFGVKAKSKADFLLQFGIVPPEAADVVIVNVGADKYRLTKEKASFGFIADAMAALAAAAGDDDDGAAVTRNQQAIARQDLEAQVARRHKALPAEVATAAGVAPRGADLAARLLASQREVLSRHMTYFAEDARDSQQ